MIEPELPRARVRDLLRPTRLYEGIRERPRFLLPTLILVLSSALYVWVAADVVLPTLVASLLDRALVTESSLRQTLRLSLLVASLLVPLVWIPLGALVSAAALRAGQARVAFPRLVSLIAYAALWLALGFVAKALLVRVTGSPAPSTNAGVLLTPHGAAARAALALTNPFLLLAVIWTVRGLRSFGAGRTAAGVAGSAPWVATAVLFATVFSGDAPLGIRAPVPVDDWPTVTAGSVTVRAEPALADLAEGMATDLDGFSTQITSRFGLPARPVRVHVYPDHSTLERAVGEKLHVLTTGSIRGSDLVYLEMPGRSAAVPVDRGRRNALRLVALLQLAPATAQAPRWFVEGFVHALVEPGTEELDREFRALVRRIGLPSLESLSGADGFRGPEGSLLARSLVDHIAALHGPATVVDVLRDVVDGADFRDALFARTRLTASELEAGWQDNLRRILVEPRGSADSG